MLDAKDKGGLGMKKICQIYILNNEPGGRGGYSLVHFGESAAFYTLEPALVAG
jgi:hypothetical protein